MMQNYCHTQRVSESKEGTGSGKPFYLFCVCLVHVCGAVSQSEVQVTHS